MILFALALAAAAPPRRLPACAAGHVSLGFDGENGLFDGMSHAGTLLVLRNVGADACAVPGLPRLSFLDAARKPLPIMRRVPVGLHPGPVVPPVGIAPGAEVTAPLRWVSGQVFDPGRCFSPTWAMLEAGGITLRMPFSGRICGPNGTPATFDQPVLRADPPPP